MKRAEIASQIFIYILGAMVVGFLFLIGLRAFTTLNENKCQVLDTQFETELSSYIDKNRAWGINKVHTLHLPCEATAICFVSRRAVEDNGASFADESPDPIIKDSAESFVDTNIFLQRSGGYEPVERFAQSAPLSIADDPTSASVDRDILCFTGSSVQVRFIGEGQTVQINEP